VASDSATPLSRGGRPLTPESAVAAGDFTNPLLEAMLRLFRPHQFPFAADPVSQKGTLFHRRGAAFGAVDHQFQSSFNVSDQRCQHPLRRVRTLHQHDEVIGVSRELVSA
jgi:hypothetical protein